MITDNANRLWAHCCLLTQCGDAQIDYTSKTKLLGVVIDNILTWREQLEKVHMSFSSQYRVLKKMPYLPPRLMEAFYYKAVIPQITY